MAGGPAATPSSAPLATLTPQERIVARAVARGRSTREVANLLVVSPRTVESHLSRIYRKLGLSGRTALAAALGSERPEDLGERMQSTFEAPDVAGTLRLVE